MFGAFIQFQIQPATTARRCSLHKHVLDNLGTSSVAVAISGSMGGMVVLEWPLCSLSGYVRHVIPLATSGVHRDGSIIFQCVW
ncbi:hypothetical protein JVU11DRAFT_12681 [Chiua virens]|nr:hypothetical protein JVU11DRAFT_12681 [Chiua virens]